jgi:hypothetical protein
VRRERRRQRCVLKDEVRDEHTKEIIPVNSNGPLTLVRHYKENLVCLIIFNERVTDLTDLPRYLTDSNNSGVDHYKNKNIIKLFCDP